jgi:amino acid transporter
LTALSFAELSRSYPCCAGAELYVEKGFSSERLSTLVGVLVMTAGLAELPERWHELVPPLNAGSWHAIYAGSLLAFYAFIGFEDMVEVAEETRRVRRNLPVGIILTLAITALLHMAIMSTAVIAMKPEELAESPVPLVSLYQHYTGADGTVISIIGLLALWSNCRCCM